MDADDVKELVARFSIVLKDVNDDVYVFKDYTRGLL